ncbi:MAG: hemolysin family protein [Anaerovoracaceae bacterium]|jgi:putative hemolysin|nr:hemolysin family protein [Anaerovoracaceae bacterium]
MDSVPDPGMPLAGQLLLLIVLIMINGFFAAAEIALISANGVKIQALEANGNKKASKLLLLMEDPNKFLSVIQVSITLAGFLASASAAINVSEEFGTYIHMLGIPYGTQIAVVLVTFVLAYIMLVFGELFPKRFAMNHSEKVAIAVVNPIILVSIIAKPFVFLISKSVDLLLIITRQNRGKCPDEFSEDEVMSMLEMGQSTGELKEEGKKMINAIFAFDDKLAYEIMTPRTDVFSIDINDDISLYMEELLEMRYSRIPVYRDDTDNIVGILYLKDIMQQGLYSDINKVDIGPLLKKPLFVPETKNIDSLLLELKSSKNHMAILIDEYGGFSGLVTMEDIIEEIVGEIEDEYDLPAFGIEVLGEGVYLVDGSIDLDDLNDEIGTDLQSEDSETLGGYLLELLGEIPEADTRGIEIETDTIMFKIVAIKDRRVEKVRLELKPMACGLKT